MELTRENQLKMIDEGIERLGITHHRLEVLSGVRVGTIGELRRGKLPMRSDNWQKISNILFPHLRSGQVPVVGHVGAGGHIFPIDDNPQVFYPGLQGKRENISMVDSLEYVEAPPGTDGVGMVAVRVDGNSMSPAMQDGWVLYYNGRQEGNFDDLLGKLCVVRLANDGAVMVKMLRRFGREPGRYNLESFNAPTLEDVQIEWAAKVTFIKPA